MSNIIAVFADGGIIGPRNPSPYGGSWAWRHVGAGDTVIAQDSGVFTDILPCTNNMSEFIALCKCLAALPEKWSGQVFCDSKITLGRLFWRWQNNNIPASWVRRAATLVARLDKCEPVLLQGHPTQADLERGIGAKRGFPVSIHNCWCDEACTAAAKTFLEGRAA